MYIALIFCLITGFIVGLIHRVTFRFSVVLHLTILMAIGIIIPLIGGSALRIAEWIPGLFYYYLVLACAVNIAVVIFLDKVLYRKQWFGLIEGVLSGFITMLIANFKLDETSVSSFYLFVLGLIYSPGLFLSTVVLKKRAKE